MMLRIVIVLFLGLAAASPPAAAQEDSAAVSSEWDLRNSVVELNQRLGHLDATLKEIDPATWNGVAAADGYKRQIAAIREQIDSLRQAGELVADDPERLSLALEVYFRLQSLETFLPSLANGIRRYQGEASANLLTSIFEESAANREQMRRYLTDLAKMKESEQEIMHREAQRCRDQVLRGK